jgi:hypothetical protein
MKNPFQNGSLRYVEANGVRFTRSVCGYCGLPCVYLGEAIRIDLAEGGFQILHVCLPCRRHLCLDLRGLSDAEVDRLGYPSGYPSGYPNRSPRNERHLEEVHSRWERRRAA